MNKGYDSFCAFIEGKTVSLIGAGVSNVPLVPFLLSCGAKSVCVRDLKKKNEDAEIQSVLADGGKVVLGEGYLSDLDEDIIIRSPGIRPDRPEFLLAKEKGLKVIYVSNGYYSEKSLEEVLGFVDAFNIDLKSMSKDFYKKVCGADLDIILDNLKRVYDEGKHLEITNLIINDYNDSMDEIEELCDFVVNELGPDVPLHFSRAFPHYKMNDISPTKPEVLYKAREIALTKGIENVHLGNI